MFENLLRFSVLKVEMIVQPLLRHVQVQLHLVLQLVRLLTLSLSVCLI